MIASLHRFTCFWLEPESEGSSRTAARNFLDTMRRFRVSRTPPEGHIYEHYNPEALDHTPGYDWLRERLDVLESEKMRTDEPAFDARPDFDPQHPVPERDPFPAFFWKMKSHDKRPWGILEVLIGRDIVLFHQCATQDAGAGVGVDALRSLEDTGWVLLHESPGALFTAEFIQVSDLGADDRTHWSANLEEFNYHSDAFNFYGCGIDYGIRLGIRQDLTSRPYSYEGLVLVEGIHPKPADDQSSADLHLDATGFITRLSTLLINSSKIEWEHALAKKRFKNIELGLRNRLAHIDDLRARRARTLATPLPRSKVEELQGVLWSARKDLEEVDQLVETCLLNLGQFEELNSQLLHGRDPWAQQSFIRLRRLIDDLKGWRTSLDHQAQWLRSEIELFVATGGRFAGDDAPELLSFSGPQTRRRRQELDNFPPLIIARQSGEDLCAPGTGTVWLVGGELKEADRDGVPLIVLRPAEISLDQRDNLTDLYVEALGDCSADGLRTLMKALCRPDSSLLLSTEKPENTQTEPIGKIFHSLHLTNMNNSKEARQVEEEILACLRHSFSSAYRKEANRQDWVAMICLLSFVEAVNRFLSKPQNHLASVAREYSSARSRLLFLMGFLHVICRQNDEAKGYLRQAARLALNDQDLAWAYFVAQFFREYERRPEAENPDPNATLSRQDTPQRQPWQELALDFLNAYDLRSAIGLARKDLRDPLQRPMAIRTLLWVLTLLTGAALLVADTWLLSSPQAGRAVVLVSVSALAILGAPLALGIGARGALRRLFPDILYPRILGAIILAAINFCATQETGTLASSRPLIFGILVVLCLGGGALYLYSEVRKRVGKVKESLLRSFDVFSLAFLEATSLSTIFALLYERMFWSFAEEPAGNLRDIFTVGGIFLRPRTIFLVAVFSMLIGIVVQLMFQSTEKPTKEDL